MGDVERIQRTVWGIAAIGACFYGDRGWVYPYGHVWREKARRTWRSQLGWYAFVWRRRRRWRCSHGNLAHEHSRHPTEHPLPVLGLTCLSAQVNTPCSGRLRSGRCAAKRSDDCAAERSESRAKKSVDGATQELVHWCGPQREHNTSKAMMT